MNIKKFVSGVSAFTAMTVTASIIMTSVAMISMPAASAAVVNTDTVFSEDFESYSNMSNVETLNALDDTGWYICDHKKLYSPVDSSTSPYKGYYKMPEIRTVDNSKVLYIQTPNQTAGNSEAKLGYGRYLPGVNDTNKKASGVYEIQFDYKPLLISNKTQFYFGLNTADGSAANDTDAQHSIMSGYDQNFYIGNRNYMTLRNDGSPILQGKLPAASIGGVTWYTVKAVVNCDAHYYSAELYNRSTGNLIARRSPISFAANESVGFLKLSALGADYAAAVYIDNVSMEKTEADPKIYEENFNSYTNDSYRASTGMTIGGGSEDLAGASYFEGYTPWRMFSLSGNYYAFETGPDSSKAVRLGSTTTGASGSSGLVYMPVKDMLVTSATRAVRGDLRVSFTIKPETISDKGYQVYFTPEYNSSGAKAFEIVNEADKVYIVTDSDRQEIDGSKWYDVELIFDVSNKTVKTRASEHGESQVLSFSTAIPLLTAVKGLLFNATGATSVILDDVKISYVPTVETTEVDLGDPEPYTTGDKVFARAFTSYITSNGITITKVNVTVPDSNEGEQTLTTPPLTLSENGDVLIGIILASKDRSTIATFDTTKIVITVE